VVGGYPSGYSGSGRDYHPVENISSDDIRGATSGRNWPASADVDAASFVGVMRAKTGSDGFDLPTEAQWEYACRAGTSGNWSVPDNQVFNVAVVSIYNQPARTHTEPVGTLAPNGWGLFDTHGNVFEWCLDWYLVGVGLGTAPQTDPPGAHAPNANFTRIIRGGSYDLLASPYSKAGYRAGQTQSGDNAHTGFRMIKREGLPRTLTVVDGKVNAGGVFYYRARIGISAADKPGETFDFWQVAPEGAFAGAHFNAQSRDTVITMPNHSITVTARYR
jgi:formylglycine-generating enzyme